MAGFAAQAALRSKWGDLVDSGSAAMPESSDVTQGLKNVVGWIKQASVEVREASKRAVCQLQTSSPNLIPPFKKDFNSSSQEFSKFVNSSSGGGGNDSETVTLKEQCEYMNTIMSADQNTGITILHFNDVYNIDVNTTKEPIGGAARFCTAIKNFDHLEPLVLFSGDAFSPSMLSTFTKGEQMIPVLNKVGTKCSVFGNHDFDHGLEVLSAWIEKTEFPWLMSNVVDNETGRPLGGGKITHILYHRNIVTIGLIGLVEKEWLDTLPTIDPKEVTYIDFVKAGNQLAEELRNEGCEIVIALTHMRTPNDIELARNCPKIDLILGGHDHCYEITEINGTCILKSGTDFRQFSKVTIDKNRNAEGKIGVIVEKIDVTSDIKEDLELKEELAKYSAMIDSKMTEVLGEFTVELDGRFEKIRTSETNLGNWVCDIIIAATGADIAMINSGTFRSDQIHPVGPFTIKDLVSIVPMQDPVIVLEVTGKTLLTALENSVSAYPKLEGRFPQVSGISFAFDPNKPPGSRINPLLVKIADQWLNENQKYALCVKSYMYGGCDGYSMFKDSPIIMDEDSCPELGLAIQNHFKAIDVRLGKAKHSKHRQSLVTMSRRHSMIQMLENTELDGPSPIRRTSLRQQSVDCTHPPHHNVRPKLLRRASLDDLEQESCQLAPSIQHRVVLIQNEDHHQELLRKRETQERNSVINEVDEGTP